MIFGESVTDNFLLEIPATPPRRLRASGFRFASQAPHREYRTPAKAGVRYSCEYLYHRSHLFPVAKRLIRTRRVRGGFDLFLPLHAR